MPNYYSYKITKDYGFAPNPFHGFCSLATCKPHIRKSAQIGDWVIGTGAITTSLKNRVIYIMLVSEKVTFEEYWKRSEYQIKKPILNGSLVRMHGDNIYFKNSEGFWIQNNSQHSNYDGSENLDHKRTDLSGKYVLIGKHFFYFGNANFMIPNMFLDVCSEVRDFFKVKNVDVANEFIKYVSEIYTPGIIGDPINWKAYNQKSLF